MSAFHDPSVIHGTQSAVAGAPTKEPKCRWIVLKDFDGVAGRTLALPADAQTRVFVLVESGN